MYYDSAWDIRSKYRITRKTWMKLLSDIGMDSSKEYLVKK